MSRSRASRTRNSAPRHSGSERARRRGCRPSSASTTSAVASRAPASAAESSSCAVSAPRAATRPRADSLAAWRRYWSRGARSGASSSSSSSGVGGDRLEAGAASAREPAATARRPGIGIALARPVFRAPRRPDHVSAAARIEYDRALVDGTARIDPCGRGRRGAAPLCRVNLELEGYRGARGGDGSTRRAPRSPPSDRRVVLLDVHLGPGAADELLASFARAGIPVVLVERHGRRRDATRAARRA